ncbi:MAG: cytochrome P450 [Myxococcales bacterium]|nr:cytochrome P450 [Myxococcales bacterium]
MDLLHRGPEFLMDLQRGAGDVASLRVGLRRICVVSHPEYVRHVLQKNHRNYLKVDRVHLMMKEFLGEGLLTISDHEKWLHKRRTVQPCFTKEALNGHVSTIAEESLRWVERMERLPDDETIRPLEQELTVLAMDIAGNALFGGDMSMHAEALQRNLDVATEEITRRMQGGLPVPRFLPTRRNARLREAQATGETVVRSLIEARTHGSTKGSEDLLSAILNATDPDTGEVLEPDALVDDALTLLAASHHTTRYALCWAVYLLAKNREWQDEVRREIESVVPDGRVATHHIEEMTLLQAIVKESLRLFPPAWVTPRAAIADDEVGGFQIKAGQEVFVSAYVTHRHPEFWKVPEGFDPTRFDRREENELFRYTYFPFGAGPRICIGRELAFLVMTTVLAVALPRLSLEPLMKGRAEFETRIGLAPIGGMPTRIVPRN